MTDTPNHHGPDNPDGPDERAVRRRAADIALGSVHAEGGEPSDTVRELVERSIAGELTPAEVTEQTLRRYRR